MLYPIKFTPIYKNKIWGGTRLNQLLNKSDSEQKDLGESWEISAIQDNISVISNGFLAGNSLQEIIETYMGDVVGEKVYQKYGIEFPLLIKFIDANDVLSIQVHPDDKLSMERHKAYGKTEMWYVIHADQNAELIVGFKKDMTQEEYLIHLNNNTLTNVLNHVPVSRGDVIYIPAGRVHAIGAGIVLAEIQQTSDITYRIFDWNRTDNSGKSRDLHTDLALNAIDFKSYTDYKTDYEKSPNKMNQLVKSPYFKTSYINFVERIAKDYNIIDSFVIYMCLDGSCTIHYDIDKHEDLKKGETVLIPATLRRFELQPQGACELLEIYLPE